MYSGFRSMHYHTIRQRVDYKRFSLPRDLGGGKGCHPCGSVRRLLALHGGSLLLEMIVKCPPDTKNQGLQVSVGASLCNATGEWRIEFHALLLDKKDCLEFRKQQENWKKTQVIRIWDSYHVTFSSTHDYYTIIRYRYIKTPIACFLISGI